MDTSYPPKKYLSLSAIQTKNLGEILASEIIRDYKNAPKVFALKGDLGAGKTTFMQGIAKGFKIKEKVLSPTFVVMKKFKLSAPFKNLYHLDCYRLEGKKDLEALNFSEIISDPQNLVFLEWPEKIKSALPKNTLWIEFGHKNLDKREICVKL